MWSRFQLVATTRTISVQFCQQYGHPAVSQVVMGNFTSSVGDTFKLTFTVSGNSGVQSRVSFNTNSPFRQLGFLVDSEDSNKTFASNALVNTNPINLSYVLRAYVLHAFIKSNLEEILSFGGFLRCTSSSIILI